MTRLTAPQDNPNHLLGNHPAYSLNEPAGNSWAESPFVAGRLNSASFLNGVIVWQKRRSRRRKALDRVVARVEKRSLPGTDYVVRFLRQMYRHNCKAKTIDSTATSLVLFLQMLQSFNKPHLEQITRRDIEAFVEKEQDRGMKINTVRFRLQNVYGFCRYLVSKEVLRADILERKLRLKLPSKLPRAIVAEDSAKILSVIDNVRDRAMILMLLRTGMRIGELRHLRVNDVDLTERCVKIYLGEKNSIGRVVYMSDDACHAVEQWLQQRDKSKAYLFYGRNGPLGYTAASDRFNAFLKRPDYRTRAIPRTVCDILLQQMRSSTLILLW